MRKVILSLAVSLDGLIEGPNGEYDWCPPPSHDEMKTFLDKIDAIFFGRKSYELAGPSAFPGKISYVFSNTMKDTGKEDVHIVSGNIVQQVADIKKQPGRHIWLYGGGNLTTTFINEGLVDEMWLGLVPVILGKGKPLFQDIRQRTHFKLTEAASSGGYASLRLKFDGKKQGKILAESLAESK